MKNEKRPRISVHEKVSVAFAENLSQPADERISTEEILKSRIKTSFEKIDIMNQMSKKIETFSSSVVTLIDGKKVCRIIR